MNSASQREDLVDESRFFGAWRLRSMERFGESGEVSHPFGEDAVGVIMYTEDGHMSANIMRSGRVDFPADSYGSASIGDQGKALRSYLAYAGRFTVEDEGKVVHRVLTSLIPNWTGGDQIRHYEFGSGGSTLTLSTHPNGDESPGRVVLVWERA